MRGGPQPHTTWTGAVQVLVEKIIPLLLREAKTKDAPVDTYSRPVVKVIKCKFSKLVVLVTLQMKSGKNKTSSDASVTQSPQYSTHCRLQSHLFVYDTAAQRHQSIVRSTAVIVGL